MYIKGTINYGSIYDYDANLDPTGYYDADWAGCPNDRRSTYGCVYDRYKNHIMEFKETTNSSVVIDISIVQIFSKCYL